ncbi:hypothetical protein [Cesiribacter andamanensis]|nr:hypothetical protein [Cesiribacter andamanensis]
MKKAYLLTALLLLLSLPVALAQAQAKAQGDRSNEKIEAARIAHITTRLNLSPEQAQKFWPVYNEYAGKRDKLRQEHRTIIQSGKGVELGNEDARKYISEHLRMEREEAALDEEYYGRKLLSVLEPRQVVQLMHAEHEFKKMLLDRLKERRAN